MKKAIIAIVSIVLILAAAAVGVTAYVSDGYKLPVSEWGERLGIDKAADDIVDNDKTPGTNIPVVDPGKDDVTDEQEEPLPMWKEISTDFYAFSESGDDATEPTTSVGYDFPVVKMKQIFEDLKDFRNKDLLSSLTLQFETTSTPGHYEKRVQVIDVIYMWAHGLLENLYGPNQDAVGEYHSLLITYFDPEDGTVGIMNAMWVNPDDPGADEVFYCEFPEGYSWVTIYGSYLMNE